MSLEEQHDSKSEFKRKRSESPVSTSTTCELADLSEGPSDEYRNKRVKTERPSSPAPSFMSLKSDLSVAPPDDFKGVMFPLDCRERPGSPTPSYLSLRTDMSIDAPNNFKREESFNVATRVGSERAPSPTLSSVSEWTECFVEQPTNFKTEATYHLDQRLLTENHMKCPVCKSILKDPVSIPCGHNFCRDCINASWDSCEEDYVCPQCGRGSKVCPELNTNTALAEVVKHLQRAGFSPALPTCSYAGPEDVACDFCSGQRLKAVKTCSTCDVVLCETHIRKHYTIAALQKHTLSDVTGAMEKKLSTQNPPTDFSSICGEQEKDKSISDSGLNTSMENEAAGISTPETDVKKDIATNFELMYSKLQQEIFGLKKSFSKFKKHNAKKDKHVEDYDEEDYGWNGSDDEESSDEEEKDSSYEDSYDMYKTDESKSENDNNDDDEYNDDYDDEYDEDEHDEYDEDEHDEYDEDEHDEYDEDEHDEDNVDEYDEDEDEDNDNSDEDDVDEYGY